MLKSLSVKSKIFILTVVILVVCVCIVGWYGYASVKESTKDAVIHTNKAKIDTLYARIDGILRTIPSDIIYNSNFYAMKQFVLSKELHNEKEIKKWKKIYTLTLRDYIQNKKIYYQIRYLDLKGNEIVSIKYDNNSKKAIIIPKHKLQNKSHRNYFKKAIKLSKGEYYISEMNLNIDYGQIEKPYIPVIRYCMPIFYNNKMQGVIVLNLNANTILDFIKDADMQEHQNKSNIYLINKNGYYLYANMQKKKMGVSAK